LTPEAYANLIKEIEKKDSENAIATISQYLSKVFLNREKGYLYLLRGDAYGEMARAGYNEDIKKKIEEEKKKKAEEQAKKTGGDANAEIKKMKDYLEQNGVDTNDMSDNEIKDSYDSYQGVFGPIGPPPAWAIVFEYQDGRATSNFYYSFYDDQWRWSSDKNEWRSVIDLPAIQGIYEKKLADKLFNPYTEQNKNFISGLQNKNYEEGLLALIQRTIKNEGGWFLGIRTGEDNLFTDKVELSPKMIFKLKHSDSAPREFYVLHNPQTKEWKWSFTEYNLNDNRWMKIPAKFPEPNELYLEANSRKTLEEHFPLLQSLKGTSLPEGAKIIFGINAG